ncbi:MAG: hypothetical protein ACP5D6_11530 [Kosmotogaceae bacterium]
MLGEPIKPEGKPIILKKKKAPKKHRCPTCGKLGTRERTRTHIVKHLAHRRQVFIEATVGVYKAKCDCGKKYFTSAVPGVEVGAEYSNAVREKVLDLIVRDGLSNNRIIEHMKEDFLLDISIGFIYLCVEWARKKGMLKNIEIGARRIFLEYSA